MSDDGRIVGDHQAPLFFDCRARHYSDLGHERHEEKEVEVEGEERNDGDGALPAVNFEHIACDGWTLDHPFQRRGREQYWSPFHH